MKTFFENLRAVVLFLFIWLLFILTTFSVAAQCSQGSFEINETIFCPGDIIEIDNVNGGYCDDPNYAFIGYVHIWRDHTNGGGFDYVLRSPDANFAIAMPSSGVVQYRRCIEVLNIETGLNETIETPLLEAIVFADTDCGNNEMNCTALIDSLVNIIQGFPACNDSLPPITIQDTIFQEPIKIHFPPLIVQDTFFGIFDTVIIEYCLPVWKDTVIYNVQYENITVHTFDTTYNVTCFNPIFIDTCGAVIPKPHKCEITIAPNPNDGEFYVDFISSNIVDEMRIELYSNNGLLLDERFVYNRKQFIEFYSENLAPGIYNIVVWIGTNGDYLATKIVVQ